MKKFTAQTNYSKSSHFRKSGFAAFLLLFAFAIQAQITYTPNFTNLWNIAAGVLYDDPTSGNNVRGISISPLTTNVVYASTSSSNHFSTLAFSGGSLLGSGNAIGVVSGTLALDQIRVADDGSVYACDLSSAPASDFKIYKWSSDLDFTNPPLIVFDSGPGSSFQWRAGDYIDLRGGGSNTEIVVVGNGSGVNITTNFLIFRPTDNYATNFTNFTITIPGGANVCGGGVAFEGTTNAIYVKAAGAKPLYRVAYNPTNLTAAITHTFQVDQSTDNGLKYYSTNGVAMLATVDVSTTAITNGIQHYAKVLQLNLVTSNLTVVLNQALPVPNQANGNSIGVADFKAGYAVFTEPNNGISFFQLGFVTNSPATVSGNSGTATLIQGYNYTFSVAGGGTAPLHYQWYYNGSTLIPGATNSTYTLSPVQLTNVGTYGAIVTNIYGSATSSVVTITVLPAGFSTLTTNLWSLAPGSRNYLDTSDSQRGMGYDPVYQRLVVVSRTPTNGVHLLDAATGNDLGDMDTSIIMSSPPGIYPINMCGVGDDGAVYVGNLLTSATSDSFAIYEYAGATNTSTMNVAYLGNPGIGRIGDTMAVRGAGPNTQILCSFRSTNEVAIFTTYDGANFNLNLVNITNLPSAAAGLGVAWGVSNTFWVKSSGYNLYQVQYDLPSGLGGVIGNYAVPIQESAIGVDNTNGFLTAIGVSESPQTLPFYDLLASGGPSLSSLIGRQVFPANNANANGTGSVAFDVTGGRVFALDTDNGILALKNAPRLFYTPKIAGAVVTWSGPGTLQSASSPLGPYSNVVAISPYTNTLASQKYFRVIR